ncbi:MAG: hypothetical protein OEM23_05655 [Gemmatimonadota bacterium]|nr:hypothetical protein [Gemmatimonadota bacterium]
MSDALPPVEIAGGAGPAETAAIMAVVAQLASEDEAARATPAQRPRQSSWVLAWRPRQTVVALPSHTFDAMPWSEVEGAEEINP